MSLASVSAQQTALRTAADLAAAQSTTSAASSAATATGATGSAAATGSSSSAASPANALSSLSGNFGDFLNMLMTQLQNQDPTSPMDTGQFTSELVQFSGVEQEINTNSSLSSLISLTQDSQMLQTSQLTGKQVNVASSQIALQNGSGAIQFNGSAGEPIAIAVTNSSGQDIKDVSLTANAGSNTWTWDGTNNAGSTMTDGPYNVAVLTANSSGTTSAVPFSVLGTVTGVSKSGSNLDLQLGKTSVDMTALNSLVQ